MTIYEEVSFQCLSRKGTLNYLRPYESTLVYHT